MTREEEAIKILKEDGCGYCTWQSINPYKCENKECKVKEALNMAIHALEKENIYDDKEHYVTISKALYDKLNIDYEKALSQEPCERFEWGIDGNVYKITKAKDGKEICQQVCDDAISRDWLKTAIHNFYYGLKHTPSEEDIQAYIDAAPFVTQKPTEGDDTVSRGVFEQVMRERDIVIEQLHELGYELGQKIEPLEVEAAKLQQAYNKGFEDCRQAVLDLINANWKYEGLEVPVNSLLPVTQKPETVTEFADRCRECGAKYGKLLKQKSGKWIEHEIKDTCRWLTCSNCGYEWINRKENYCPNCGAKMVEPQESKKVNCKSTKCENCINHNYCDYEPQESEE